MCKEPNTKMRENFGQKEFVILLCYQFVFSFPNFLYLTSSSLNNQTTSKAKQDPNDLPLDKLPSRRLPKKEEVKTCHQ